MPQSFYAHYVCFNCRLCFAPPTERHNKHDGHNHLFNDPHCPSCNEVLIGLGLCFEPPKQNNKRAWRKLEDRVQRGERFTIR